jgi:hypothetical protein
MIHGITSGQDNLLCRLPLLVLLMGFAPSQSIAASPPKPLKDQLVATWTLVSIADEANSKGKSSQVQPPPGFTTTFEANGRVTSTIAGAGTITETNGKTKPVDLRAVTFSGTYTINEADKTVTYQAERDVLSVLRRTDPKTTVAVKGNQLEQVVHPAGSSATTRLVWQRVK